MKPKRRALMLFFMIGLPIILILTGLLDFWITQLSGTADSIAKNEATLRELANLQPGGLKATLLDIHPILDWITAVGGVLALAWAVAGLVILRRLARQAMQSREALLNAFSRGQKLLPGYIVILTLILGTSLVTAVILVSIPALIESYRSPDQSIASSLCVCVFAVAVFSLGGSVAIVRTARRALTTPQPLKTLGSMVSREQAPKLWAFVERVAERVGTRMPNSIIVGLDQFFFMTEQPVRLRNGDSVPPGRVLYMPRPYLAFLNEAEVSAIVGHEMGHFVGEDAIYSQKFLPAYLAIARQVKAVSAYSIRRNIVWGAAIFSEMYVEFLSIFHKAVRHWERQFNWEHQRELAADAVGVQVAGTQTSAVALLRVAALSPRIDAALGHYLDEGVTNKGNVMADVRRRIAAQGLADPREQSRHCQPHPTDTHLRLAERLEALRVSATDPALLKLAMNPAASSLLCDWGLEPPCAEASTPGQTADAASTPDVLDAPNEQAGAASVSAASQQELSQTTASIQQEKIDELTHAAAQVRKPQAIREFKGLTISVTILALAMLTCFLWATIGILIHTGPQAVWADIKGGGNAPGELVGFAIFFLLFAVIPGFLLGKILRACFGPVVVSVQGLQLPGASGIAPWNAIVSMSTAITSVRYVNEARIYLTFAHGIEPTLLAGKSRKLKYDKREKRWILSVKGLSEDAASNVASTFMKYWVAGRAHAELQRMGVEV